MASARSREARLRHVDRVATSRGSRDSRSTPGRVERGAGQRTLSSHSVQGSSARFSGRSGQHASPLPQKRQPSSENPAVTRVPRCGCAVELPPASVPHTAATWVSFAPRAPYLSACIALTRVPFPAGRTIGRWRRWSSSFRRRSSQSPRAATTSCGSLLKRCSACRRPGGGGGWSTADSGQQTSLILPPFSQRLGTRRHFPLGVSAHAARPLWHPTDGRAGGGSVPAL